VFIFYGIVCASVQKGREKEEKNEETYAASFYKLVSWVVLSSVGFGMILI